MAGIGFELKKIFEENTISSKVKGFSYATLISVGPMIVSVLMLIMISGMLKSLNIDIANRELITASIMYAYIFSMISVSGFVLVISRYVSDKLYMGEVKDVLSSIVGVVGINLLIGGTVAMVFYYNSPLDQSFKVLSYLFFLELSVIYILIAYISALKDYMRIVMSFAIGALIAVLASIFFVGIGTVITSAVLGGMVFGFLFTIVFMLIAIKNFFRTLSPNVFSFLHYMYKMPYLFLINLCYTFGLFAHNFIFWRFSDISREIMDTYMVSTNYDDATFFAVLTIIPATVLFVVRVETTFYKKYRKFCRNLEGGGTLKNIESAKREMISVLRKELINIIQVQFVLTLLLVVFGVLILLPVLGKDRQTIELFVLLAIGYFMTYMTFIMITILLYFDNQEDSFKIATIFLLTNSSLTYISVLLGETYYGLGLPISALISFMIGNYYLNKTLENIDYRLFSKGRKSTTRKGYISLIRKRSDNYE